MKKYLMIIIFIISICCSLFLKGKLYFIGSQSEREAILSATVWQLSKEGYKENQIEEVRVRYNPMKGGVIPYDAIVVFKNDTSTAKIYSWSNADKKGIENVGTTAP